MDVMGGRRVIDFITERGRKVCVCAKDRCFLIAWFVNSHLRKRMAKRFGISGLRVRAQK